MDAGVPVIYTCPVNGCGVLHEMGSDHQSEPCTSCWRAGWRINGVGNVYQLREPESAPFFAKATS